MAHAQKSDLVFRRNGRVHLNRRGTSVQSTTGSRDVRISGNNAGYIVFRGSVKSTGYPLHSPVSSSLLLPCVTVCHQVLTRPYLMDNQYVGGLTANNARNKVAVYFPNRCWSCSLANVKCMNSRGRKN
jgi:hypothetical protein